MNAIQVAVISVRNFTGPLNSPRLALLCRFPFVKNIRWPWSILSPEFRFRFQHIHTYFWCRFRHPFIKNNRNLHNSLRQLLLKIRKRFIFANTHVQLLAQRMEQNSYCTVHLQYKCFMYDWWCYMFIYLINKISLILTICYLCILWNGISQHSNDSKKKSFLLLLHIFKHSFVFCFSSLPVLFSSHNTQFIISLALNNN